VTTASSAKRLVRSLRGGAATPGAVGGPHGVARRAWVPASVGHRAALAARASGVRRSVVTGVGAVPRRHPVASLDAQKLTAPRPVA